MIFGQFRKRSGKPKLSGEMRRGYMDRLSSPDKEILVFVVYKDSVKEKGRGSGKRDEKHRCLR